MVFNPAEFLTSFPSSVSQTRQYVMMKIPSSFDYELLFEAIFTANCKNVEMTAIESAEKQMIKLEYVVDLLPDIRDSRLM
ncbi:hypothetical protein ACWOB6_03005 [Falseniella ignava]